VNEDWCIIGSSVPRAMMMNMIFDSRRLAASRPNFSKKVGANSIHITRM